jgi:uncharacterized ferritin-like protein (DUF455 family)
MVQVWSFYFMFLSYLCEMNGLDKYEQFHSIVDLHFVGKLKPPFNKEDRLAAGIDEGFYSALI